MHQVCLKLASGSAEDYFLNFINVFLLFHYNLPLEIGASFIWTNLNPLPPRMLYAKFSWIRLAQWFWRRNFQKILLMYFCFYVIGPVTLEKKILKNFVKVFSLFRYYLLLEKGGPLIFEQIWIPFTQDCFVPSLIDIGLVVLGKKISKFYKWISAISLFFPP